MKKDPLQDMTRNQAATEVERLRRRLAELETAQRELQKVVDALQEREENYRLLLDESSDPIFMFERDGTYRYANQAFAEGVGRSVAVITGNRIWDVFPKDEADKRFAVVKWVFENGETKVIEVRVPRPDGDRYYITTVKPVLDERNTVVSVICISKEITYRKRMEEELRHLSTHDALTGLYSRAFFDVEMARIQESRLFPVSVVVVDIDNLKMVNDRNGHAAGDELICRTARALRESFRSEDILARFGGDEFVVLLPETGDAAVEARVNRLRDHVEQEHDPDFGLSMGSASGEKGSLLSDLIRLADDRMYQDKMLRKK
jgi:diguanylate cyclase (GGDEF)-like protein/PAS domain S-box-containing protein